MSRSLTDSLISRKWTAFLRFTLLVPALLIVARSEFCEQAGKCWFSDFSTHTHLQGDFVVQKPNARSILLWTPERISRMAPQRFSGESEKWRRFGVPRWQFFSFSQQPYRQGMSTAVRQRINQNRKINPNRKINLRRRINLKGRINLRKLIRARQRINLGTPTRVRERRKKTSRTSGNFVNDTWPKHELRQSIFRQATD